MLKNEKEKFYLSTALILIICGLLIWQGIANVKKSIEKNISEIKDKKVSIAAYSFKEKSLPANLENYNFSKSKIEKFNDYFVYVNENDDVEFSYFFSQLDSIAAQTGNSLVIDLYQSDSLDVKNKKSAAVKVQEKTADSRSLKLTLKGNFDNLLKFISYMEAMPYYVYIDSVNINIDNDAKDSKYQNSNNKGKESANLLSVLAIKVFKKQKYNEY